MAAFTAKNTNPISFQDFKTIPRSDGTYSTWTDIWNMARTTLPINEDILNVHFKSMQDVTGDNIVFSNISTKFVEWFREDLSYNNKLELNKMVMFLYNDFMSPIEYSLMDRRSAADWASILSESIQQMFLTKRDVSNMLAIDEIYKMCLALGEFTIIPNGDQLITKPNSQDTDFEAYKRLGVEIVKIQYRKMRRRTKFAKGIQRSRWRWVNSPEFGLNLLAGKTASYAGSDIAYKDLEQTSQVGEFLGMPFTTSIYLNDKIDMNEFTSTINQQIKNQGVYTGNLIKPYDFTNILCIGWVPDSLLYFGHRLGLSERWAPNTRTINIDTFIWRSQVAILPILAHFNHIFITKIPVMAAYERKDGVQVQEFDLNVYDQYVAWKKIVLSEQDMLYNTLINPDGTTNNGVTDQVTWTKYINDNTLQWAGTNWAPFALQPGKKPGKQP